MSSNNNNSSSNSPPHGKNLPSPGGHNNDQSPSIASSIDSNNSITGTLPPDSESPISTQSSVPLEGSLPNGIKVTKRTIEGATWPADLILDLGKSNWLEWSCQLGLLVLQHGLTPWLEGTLTCPNALVSPDDHRVWTNNDDALRGFIRDHISSADIEHVEFSGCTTAHDLFMRGYFRRITAMGKIKDDDILTAILLHSISDRFGPFASHRQAVQDLSHHPNVDFDMIAKCILDQVELSRRCQPTNFSTHIPILNPSAFAALKSLQRAQKPVCSNCKRTNHLTDYCTSSGGKMSGRTVKEARAAYRAALAKS
ncbi:hypothetical protein BGY98DRAFT_955297 [Russula aff. rugulosa BPL654]|nr:hypothetical protein BGY98DRAFT_955297 [Russula aff. rugulosa BPL654]